MTQSSDRISTRTRRRSATGAGKAPPAVDYGFGPGGAPRSSSRRVTTPSRVPRPRPAPPAAATPALADSPVRTVPLPSDRDHAEPMRTPFLRLTPCSGDTPTAPARLDALGDVAELRFADSVARYSHDNWKREQHAEPTCHATMRYTSIGRPSVLPPDFLACYPSHKRPSLSDIQGLAGEGRLHRTDDDIVLLVRDPTPLPIKSDKPISVEQPACLLNDKPVRIYAPLLMGPYHASLSFDGLLPSWHHARVAHAGAVLLVDWHECVHPVMASPLLDVPSAENPTADCPLANHLNASTGRSRCRRQC